MDLMLTSGPGAVTQHGKLMMVLAALGFTLFASFPVHAKASVLQSRLAIDKSKAVFSIEGSRAATYERIVIKFNEGSDVRQTLKGMLSSKSPAVQAELKSIEQRYKKEGLSLRRLFAHFDTDKLDGLKRSIEETSGKQLADLNLYFDLPVPPGTSPQKLEQLIAFFNQQSAVEIAYATAPPQLAALKAPNVSSSPSHDGSQGYRLAAPGGIDAVYASTIAGGRGLDVNISDVEGGWRLTHEDMPITKNLGGNMSDPAWTHHGTAVMGVMGGRNNGYGVTGIAHDAGFSVSGIGAASTADAILKAGTEAGKGGVLLVELQQVGPADSTACACNQSQCNSLPMEYWPAEYDAIKYVTAQGVTVVEAAGNGSVNLDEAVYNNYFNRQTRDSGAILVAASVSHARTPACFTNYGSRIDAHGWGENVATLSYGDLSGTTEDNFYTGSFSGTSSATPIVAGAVASIQGVNLVRKGVYLSPAAVRTLIKNTGTAQSGSLTTNIGPMPNLRSAIDSIAPATLGTVTISGSILNGTTATAFTGISGTGASCTVNATAGTYSCTVANAWSGTLTPSHSGYTFTPASRSYVGVQANRTLQNFQIASNASQISITGNVGNAGIAMPNVQIVPATTSGTASCSSTQLDGSYRCVTSSGWTGSLSASAVDYSFLPTSRSFTNVTSNQTAQNFNTPVLNRAATIYYKRGFSTPYMHYRPNGGSWSVLPGAPMTNNDSDYCGYSKHTVELGSATNVEVAFNDGANNWDSNYGSNYWFSEGVSTYTAGTTAAGAPNAAPCSQSVTFKVTASTVWGENIYIVGNIPELGSWDAARAVQMSSAAYPVWSVTQQLPVPTAVEYKYIRKDAGGAVTWEGGSNRLLSIIGSGPTVREDGDFRP